jgi:hypothetical protein
MFRPQETLQKTRAKSYNTLALSAPLHRSENWNIKARDARKMTAAEMKHIRKRVGYTWTYYKTNTETENELNSTAVLDKIQEYRRNWLQHINKRPHNRLPRILKKKTTEKLAEETIQVFYRSVRP